MIALLLLAGAAAVYAAVRLHRANRTVERILTEARINDQAAADRAEARSHGGDR